MQPAGPQTTGKIEYRFGVLSVLQHLGSTSHISLGILRLKRRGGFSTWLISTRQRLQSSNSATQFEAMMASNLVNQHKVGALWQLERALKAALKSRSRFADTLGESTSMER